MKYCLLTVLTIAFFSMYGQRYAKEYIVKFDTLNTIKLSSQEDQRIMFRKNDNEFRFDKDATLSILKKVLEDKKQLHDVAKDTINNPVLKQINELTSKQINDLQSIIGYLQSAGSVLLRPYDPSKNYEQVKKDLNEFTSYYLYGSIFCEIIDSGNFSLSKNGIVQTKLNKVKITYSDAVAGTSDNVYILPDGEMVWTCLAQ